MNDRAFTAKMAELSARFAARAMAECDALEAAIASGSREDVRQLAHRLSGVAAMFGHPQVGLAASALEEAAESDMPMDTPAATLRALLLELGTGPSA